MGILTDEQVQRLRNKFPTQIQPSSLASSSEEAKKHVTASDSLNQGQCDADRISALVLPNAGQSLDGETLRNLRKPGVYILMRGETVLYVGLGTSLMGRLAGTNHRQSDKAIARCDRVLLYPCVSESAANELETMLITRLQPEYNYNKKWVRHAQVLGASRREKIRQMYAPNSPTRAEFMKRDETAK